MDFGHPPPNMNMPPPGMGGGGPMGPPPRPQFRHSFRPYNNYQLRFPPGGPLNMTQDDFDGKRLRKSVMRKTVDYNAAIIKALECRVWQRDWRDRHALQPDAMYTPDLMPPPSYPDNPINAVTTRFVKTATNKMRCPIFAVAWTPEGRRLVTGASSGEFTLWNGLTFNFETILQAHDSPVRSMVWSHGEGWMVTGDHSGFIKYWQSNMNNVKMYQAHKEAVRGISFSPSDSKIVTCSDDGTLRIFDFYRCHEERILRGHGADVKCVQWHPTKALIVSGSKDNQQPIKLWDPKSGTALSTLHAHKSTVMDLKWNDNGNWLITASRDHLLKLFDIRKLGTELQIFRGHKKEASSVAWHPTHEGLFCSGGSDGAILFWNVGTDKEVGSIEGAHESIVWTMAWHPLGHILCSGSNDHTCKFWTRNRPGDLMRDKYNLNTLPPGVQEDHDLEEPSIIPGMGPEDKVEIFSTEKDTDKPIPGLDLDTSLIPVDFDKKIKKVPYSKPIPRNFQAQWNHGPAPDEVGAEAFAQSVSDTVPGTIPLKQIQPTAIFIYGKFLQVEPGSRLERAIMEGPIALKKYIATGEIEVLEHVMPHLDDDLDEESILPFQYPDPEPDDVLDDDDPNKDRYYQDDYYCNDIDMGNQNDQNDYDNYNGPDMNNMGPRGPSGNMMGPSMQMGPRGPMNMGPPPGLLGIRPNMPMNNMSMNNMGPQPPYNDNMGPIPPYNDNMGLRPPYNDNMGPRPPFNDNMGPRPQFNDNMGPRPPFNDNMGPRGQFNHNMGQRPPFNDNMGPRPSFNDNMGPRPPFNDNMGPRPPFNDNMGPRPPFNDNMGPRPPFNEHLGPRAPFNNNIGNIGPRPPFNDNMGNMSQQSQLSDDGYNKGYNDEPNFDDQFHQHIAEYNEEESYDQSFTNNDEENHNNEEGDGGEGYDDRQNAQNQRWSGGGGGGDRGGFRGRGGRGRGRGVNGRGGGNWRGPRRGRGANRGFRRGGKSIPK